MQILPVVVKNSNDTFSIYYCALSKYFDHYGYYNMQKYSSSVPSSPSSFYENKIYFYQGKKVIIGNKQYFYSIGRFQIYQGYGDYQQYPLSNYKTNPVTKTSLYSKKIYFHPSTACIESSNLSNFEDIVTEWMNGKLYAVNIDKFNQLNGFNMSAYSGWIGTSPSLVEISQMKLNGINFSSFQSVFTSLEYSGGNEVDTPPVPNPDGGTTNPGGGTSPTPTPNPNPPSGGGGSGGGSSSSGQDYSSILSNILAKLDSINQSIQSGDFKAVLNNFNTIITQLTEIKKISNAISEGIGQLQTQLDLLIDNLSNIHCNFDDKNIVQTIKYNTDRVVNKLDELLKKDVKVDFNQTVNQDGTNFWDFLTSLIDGLTETLKNLLDFGSSIFEKLFDILDKLVSWLCDKLYGLIVPTGDYKEKMESQIDKLKTDSGFVWQSFELLGTLKDTLEGANTQSVGATDSNAKFTFTWSDVQLMGQTVISAGSAHPQEYIDSLGFHDAQEVCNQICDALLLYGAILFVISQLKEYFE